MGTYLFIDGGYLRERYQGELKRHVGAFGKIQLSLVAGAFAPCERVFYYDCLDDLPREGEDDTSRSERVKQQEEEFDRIRALDGFHVREGTLSGAKRRHQKKVDILLAVDMLEHAFRKNMDLVRLLAGDADFVPLVEAVVRLGIRVEVIYSPRGASRELYRAADRAHALTFETLYSWSDGGFKTDYQLPTSAGLHLESCQENGWQLMRSGRSDHGGWVRLYSKGTLVIAAQRPDSVVVQMGHKDINLLLRFFEAKYGPVKWADASASM